jgi:predicted aspartyl protease
MTDMGVFRTSIAIEHLSQNGVVRELPETLVDTGSEYTWAPAAVLEELGIHRARTQQFIVADGRAVMRDMGVAIVHAAGTWAPDWVVFAESTDIVLLGTRSLEGLNLKVDVMTKTLVPAGPIITAAAA